VTAVVICELCHQVAAASGRYLVSGSVGLMVCSACSEQIVEKEHDPYSGIMRLVYREVGLKPVGFDAQVFKQGGK